MGLQPIAAGRCLWLAWNEGLVLRLAQVVYEGRTVPNCQMDNVRLRILADTLQEAACTDEIMLEHLRQAEEHPQTCWAVEAILGRGRGQVGGGSGELALASS